MSCGLFDLACHAQQGLNDLLVWALGLLSIPFLIGLVIGSVLGARYGWLAVVTLGIGAALAIVNQRRPEPAPVSSPVTADRVRTLQLALAAHGFDPGPSDGKFGRQTHAALTSYAQTLKPPVIVPKFDPGVVHVPVRVLNALGV